MAAPEGYNALGKIGISYKGEYSSTNSYTRLDAVYHNGSTYLALKDAPLGAPNNDGINWMYLAKGFTDDVGESQITFEQASERTNIATGESIKTVFGKIKKWFADMTAAAFAQIISSNTDLMATTVAGYLPDALAVKNQFDAVDSNLKILKSSPFATTVANELTTATSIKDIIYACRNTVTPIAISKDITDIPSGYAYSFGFIFRRTADQYWAILFKYRSAETATICATGKTAATAVWTDWTIR